MLSRAIASVPMPIAVVWRIGYNTGNRIGSVTPAIPRTSAVTLIARAHSAAERAKCSLGDTKVCDKDYYYAPNLLVNEHVCERYFSNLRKIPFTPPVLLILKALRKKTYIPVWYHDIGLSYRRAEILPGGITQMASARQIEANRKNARKCTGPTSPEGKTRSKFNGLKHGLTAATVVLPYEDEIAYHELRGQVLEDFTPECATDWMLVDQVASAWWRTIRARNVETSLMEAHSKTLLSRNEVKRRLTPKQHFEALAIAMASHPEDTFKNFHRYEASIERSFYRAYDRLQKLIDKRNRERQRQAPQPAAVQVCSEMGLVSSGRAAAAGQASGQASNEASIVISAFNSFEIGQPTFAFVAQS